MERTEEVVVVKGQSEEWTIHVAEGVDGGVIIGAVCGWTPIPWSPSPSSHFLSLASLFLVLSLRTVYFFPFLILDFLPFLELECISSHLFL